MKWGVFVKNIRFNLSECEKELESIAKELLNLPSGFLKRRVRKKRAFYYHKIDEKETGITSNTKLIRQLCRFKGKLIIQTMFLQGEREGIVIDNTFDEEIAAWICALKKINPRKVMIYTIDRDTPVQSLQKISASKLEAIAKRVKEKGFEISVSI